MGDRGNIKIAGVYLYTHWFGSSLNEIVARVLKRKERWDDESYLARMIFCEMIKDDIDGTTGYGISSYETDNDKDIVDIDVDKQQIKNGQGTWDFDEFIEKYK